MVNGTMMRFTWWRKRCPIFVKLEMTPRCKRRVIIDFGTIIKFITLEDLRM